MSITGAMSYSNSDGLPEYCAAKDDVATLTVTAPDGYTVGSVVLTLEGAASTPVELDENGGGSFTMPGVPVTLTAGFGKTDYAINTGSVVIPDGYEGNGTLSILVNNEAVTAQTPTAQVGDEVKLVFTAQAHNDHPYAATAVTLTSGGKTLTPDTASRRYDSNNGSYVSSYTFTMPADAVAVAGTYARLYDVSLNVAGDLAGITADGVGLSLLDMNDRVARAAAGETVALEPGTGCHLGMLRVAAVSQGSGSDDIDVTDNCFVMPSDDVSATAWFGAAVTVEYDEQSAAGAEVTPMVYDVISENMIAVQYAPPEYTVIMKPSSGFLIADASSGDVSLEHGDEWAFVMSSAPVTVKVLLAPES